MRNPARKALYCFLILLAAAALIRFGALRLDRVEGDWPGTGALALGFALVAFPLYTLVEALLAMRGRALLLAGQGVIARWQVQPAEWERFRGLDSSRASEDPALGNALWIQKRAPAQPVEVIVGAGSALIDGSYHRLKPGGLPDLRGVSWLEGPPACLEFALRYPRSRYGPPVPATLRIPVPASARSEARRVFDHFEAITRPGPGIAPRKIARAYGICGFLLLGTIAVSGLGYALVPGVPGGNLELTFLGLLIGASILASLAAIFVLATILLTPRR